MLDLRIILLQYVFSLGDQYAVHLNFLNSIVLCTHHRRLLSENDYKMSQVLIVM